MNIPLCRTRERDQISRISTSGRNAAIITPPQGGATTLLEAACAGLPADAILIRAESGHSSPEAVAEGIAESVMGITFPGRCLRTVRRMCRGLSVTLTHDALPGARCEIAFRGDGGWQDAYLLPARLGRETGKPVTVAWDRFDEWCMDGSLTSTLRPAVMVPGACWLFAGSRQWVMEESFLFPAAPMGGTSVPVMPDSFTGDQVRRYVEAFCLREGWATGREVGNVISHFTGGHPGTLFLLLSACPPSPSGVLTVSSVCRTWETLIMARAPAFRVFCDTRRKNERCLIRAIVSNEKRLYAEDTVRRYGFSSSAAVRHALLSLLHSDVVCPSIGGYRLSDPLFAAWARWRMEAEGEGERENTISTGGQPFSQ